MLFGDNGYVKFNYDEQIVKWADCAREKGSEILANPGQLEEWLQCEGTCLLASMSYQMTQVVVLVK